MARSRRRKVTRGWVVQDGVITVDREAVDNVLTRCDVIVAGTQFDDPAPVLAGDDGAFFIKRLIVDMDVVCNPTALNQTGMLPFTVGLFVADQGLVEYVLTNAELNLDLLVNYDQLLDVSARVLQCDMRWAYAQSAAGEPAIAQPDAAYHNRFTWDLSYRGGLNVRTPQALYLAFGQSEFQTQQWIDGDQLIANYNVRALVQERVQP